MVKCKTQECPIWREKQKYILMHCESIFDAAFNMSQFEKECLKTCKEDIVKKCDMQD